MAKLAASTVRSLLKKRDFSGLKKAVSAEPRSISALWTKLSPLERAACWRLLPSGSLEAAVAVMSPEAAWQAYLSQPVECLAPLLEDAPSSARRLFRSPSPAEAKLLRARLS